MFSISSSTIEGYVEINGCAIVGTLNLANATIGTELVLQNIGSPELGVWDFRNAAVCREINQR